MPETKALSEPQKALRKLGLARDIDLALHLPLRYEDETRIVRLRDAREGDTAQIEATVTACEIAYRPRRQLLVTVDDGSDTCVLRFFSFYPSQQKALAVGNRLRVRGELKGGFLGWQMVHPDLQAGRRRTAGGADAGVFHRRQPAPGLPAQGGARRPGAGRPVRHLSARRQRNAAAAGVEPARSAGVPAPARRPTCRWPRWKTAATRPGSG